MSFLFETGAIDASGGNGNGYGSDDDEQKPPPLKKPSPPDFRWETDSDSDEDEDEDETEPEDFSPGNFRLSSVSSKIATKSTIVCKRKKSNYENEVQVLPGLPAGLKTPPCASRPRPSGKNKARNERNKKPNRKRKNIRTYKENIIDRKKRQIAQSLALIGNHSLQADQPPPGMTPEDAEYFLARVLPSAISNGFFTEQDFRTNSQLFRTFAQCLGYSNHAVQYLINLFNSNRSQNATGGRASDQSSSVPNAAGAVDISLPHHRDGYQPNYCNHNPADVSPELRERLLKRFNRGRVCIPEYTSLKGSVEKERIIFERDGGCDKNDNWDNESGNGRDNNQDDSDSEIEREEERRGRLGRGGNNRREGTWVPGMAVGGRAGLLPNTLNPSFPLGGGGGAGVGPNGGFPSYQSYENSLFRYISPADFNTLLNHHPGVSIAQLEILAFGLHAAYDNHDIMDSDVTKETQSTMRIHPRNHRFQKLLIGLIIFKSAMGELTARPTVRINSLFHLPVAGRKNGYAHAVCHYLELNHKTMFGSSGYSIVAAKLFTLSLYHRLNSFESKLKNHGIFCVKHVPHGRTTDGVEFRAFRVINYLVDMKPAQKKSKAYINEQQFSHVARGDDRAYTTSVEVHSTLNAASIPGVRAFG
jgi:hypothetical protein